MPGGFSFQRYPMQPGPAPAQVGQSLGPTAPSPGVDNAPAGYLPYAPAVTGNAQGAGAALMAPPAPPEPPPAPGADDRIHAAVGDMLMRQDNGGGTSPIPTKPTARHAAHLQALGLHPTEVAALTRNGGL